MLFYSPSFLWFFLGVYALFHMVPGRWRWMVLLAASLLFYMFDSPFMVLIPLVLILTAWFGASLIARERKPGLKKMVFFLGAGIILGVLVFYKYLYVILLSCSHLCSALNLQSQGSGTEPFPWLQELMIPLGLSYITFQSLAYLIEVYRGTNPALPHLGYFATFLLFFPKIFAGPVERAHLFIPQLAAVYQFDYQRSTQGIRRFCWGFFKKTVVSAQLLPLTDAFFNHPEDFSGIYLMAAAFLFLLQLYADFSGYTDMAIGLAQLFGLKLTENFRLPYRATTTTELWRRWHISLSTWFFEYVFNPLALSARKLGKWAVVLSVFVTFLLLGLWHGANLTFIVFGLLQAVFLSIEFLSQKIRRRLARRLPPLLTKVTGFLYVTVFFSVSLVFFRAASFEDAMAMLQRMFYGIPASFNDLIGLEPVSHYEGDRYNVLLIVFFIVLMIFGDEFFNHDNRIKDFLARPLIFRWMVYCFFLVLIAWFGVFGTEAFIYFRF
ncbi:MAG TPA: MBOAT family O-acyltransferase [Bacteroidales bacterium]|nr:MBOAT family O-acyltransferase [Bacteroidales bacterium]HSA43420.1 MBOAT family O-acyltransferase [Bacteroidales bacterium]